ncbi:hypothetical protein ACFFG9_45330 [Kutzneria buriramensis]
MATAHRLFHQDSKHILARTFGPGDRRREHTILLCSAMLRAAGQDWHEQGDVWGTRRRQPAAARPASERPVTGPCPRATASADRRCGPGQPVGRGRRSTRGHRWMDHNVP